jgi:hypothetical protein
MAAAALGDAPVVAVEDVLIEESFEYNWGTPAARGTYRGDPVLVVVRRKASDMNNVLLVPFCSGIGGTPPLPPTHPILPLPSPPLLVC